MKNFFRVLLVGLFLLGSKSAMADTLQFVFSDQPGYPFQFKVNGSNTITNLMCLDMDRRVTYNEKWNVDITGIPLDNSLTSTQYRADALIFSQLGGGYSNAELQYAAWSIFDMADVATTLSGTANAKTMSTVLTIDQLAWQRAQDQVLIKSGFFSAFSLYLPTTDTTGWTAGTPQRYIGAAAAAVTPEPGTIALMITGVLCMGCAVLYRRRFSDVMAGNLA